MRSIYYTILFIFFCSTVFAKSERFRCIIRDEPATSICIGWDQVSGGNPQLYYGPDDNGGNAKQYPLSALPQKTAHFKGMHNHFVRLSNLKPNTVYYFVVIDSDGTSKRYSFRTLPDDSEARLSIITGGDSRNQRDARVNANKIVAKVRPHFVLFDGDMTDRDTNEEWKEWLDDWTQTFGSDGRITAIVPARGNHEFSNSTLIELFDIKHPDLYYGLTFARGLLRVYTLNSLIPAAGMQREWLERDLSQNQHIAWRFAQYHLPMRPHTKRKPENEEQRKHWAPLFERFKVQLAIECDIHLAKYTYPIVSSNQRGNIEGFVRDDANGVTYIGEGGWGAPLRENNDNKAWTRASGSFNQVQWLFVDLEKVEIRTIKTDNAGQVASLAEQDRFKMPANIDLWKPDGLEVLSMFNKQKDSFKPLPKQILTEIKIPKAAALADGSIELTWQTIYEEKGMHYRIQYSTNKLYWKTIAEAEGVGANVTKPNEYVFNDPSGRRNGKVYYRIIALDAAGAERHKAEVEARSLSIDNDMETIKVSLSTGLLKTTIDLALDATTLIEIYDTERKVVFVQKMPLKTGKQQLSLNVRHLKTGQHLLEITQGAQTLRRNLLITN